MKDFDVAIIGGGVIGSAVARELARYKLDIGVFEKSSDVASGASKANSGVLHSGINSPSGSLKAHYCVEGNKQFQSLAKELGISVKWVGKLVVAKNNDEIKELEHLRHVGIENKVPNLEIKTGSEVKKQEPNVSCVSALWVPTAGIILPYEFTIALAENAAVNGVQFFLETEVTGLKKQQNGFVIKTNQGVFQAKIIINAAGTNCKNIVSLLEEPDFEVYPCRGEYLVLDKNYCSIVNSMIYPVPVKGLGVLGVHITPTIEGNILLGPSAEFIDDPEDTRTTKKVMETLLMETRQLIPALPTKAVINTYSGIRCKLAPPESGGWKDYRIEESKHTSGFINLLGIESPGLTSAPAIAQEITKMIGKHIEIKKKPNFKIRKIPGKRFAKLSPKEQVSLINNDDRWGRIICRCEQITEKEVIEALSNPIKAQTLSSVKFRCRAGMGRCQGGFCTQHIIRIMEKQYNINISDMKLKSPKSNLFTGRTREVTND